MWSSVVSRRLPLVSRVGTTFRGLAMKRRETFWDEPLPEGYTMDSVKPPSNYENSVTEHLPPRDKGPAVGLGAQRNPVTSAHAIDGAKVSARDSAALGPSGTVVHGRYGDLGPDVAQSIPLEYLALLRPAAEGAAVVRALQASEGTLLVYGASQPAALSAVQLAASSGKTVVAVVGGEHAGNKDMMDIVKNLTPEPGFAVPEEFAMVKKNFSDILDATINGEPEERRDADGYLKAFKANLLEYADTFPETLPAAVNADMVEFQGQERDRETFRDNIDPYLQQNFPAGSPPFDPAMLDKNFATDQYAVFKNKFHEQTTAVITGDDAGKSFDAPHLVHSLMISPESTPELQFEADDIQYEFSIFKAEKGIPLKKGGPIVGAIIGVTPGLEVAAKAVDEAGPSLRARAEALQFLTATQRNAYSAAMSLLSHAKQAGAPVYALGGSLPGLKNVEPTDEDVQEALAAMELDERGRARLNCWIQVYRSQDYPVYADYAIHRSQEDLSGPRQIVVTK